MPTELLLRFISAASSHSANLSNAIFLPMIYVYV